MNQPKKVLAYIIRDIHHIQELLVFRQRDYPLAGIQVPAGTVNEGESLEQAVLREVEEESGLTDLTVLEEVAIEEYLHEQKRQLQNRHFFHLKLPDQAQVKDTWEFTVSSGTNDSGLVFIFYWLPLDQAGLLAVDQGKYIPNLTISK